MDDTRVIMLSIRKAHELFGMLGQGVSQNKWQTKDINYVKEYERIQTVMSLLEAVEDSDYTRVHCTRVGSVTKLVAEEMDISKKSMLNVTRAAYFHDIGKIKLTEEVLRPGKLTPKEFEQVKKHSEYGYKILKSIGLDREAKIVLQHHERIDGSGYPYGLKKDELEESSIILGVVDTFDAMTSPFRTYKKSKSIRETLDYLYENKERYDQDVVQSLNRVLDFRLN
ncbi:MAG: HD-GYP domain-containing protein [Candidatus Kariarchaeaceae archaeon]